MWLKQHRGCFGSGDGYVRKMVRTVSEYNIPERILGSREDYHQTRKRLAENKTRLVEATHIYDACNVIQRVVERLNVLNATQKLAEIATKGALNCGARMGKAPAQFDGETVGFRSDVKLIELRLGSIGVLDLNRFMQAVGHGLPVDTMERGILDAPLQHGNQSSTLQHSGSLLDILMEDIVGSRVLPLHWS